MKIIDSKSPDSSGNHCGGFAFATTILQRIAGAVVVEMHIGSAPKNNK